MIFHFWRGSGYLLLAAAGWVAGRWAFPPVPGVEGKAGGPVPETGAQVHPEMERPAPGTRTAEDVLKAGGKEEEIREKARLLALEPPPALTDFLSTVTDSESLRAALLEDAVVWAFSRRPEAGLALLSSLAERAEIRVLVENTLRFFPPKDLPVVLAWYHRMPETKLKAEARNEVVRVLASRDFRQAAALVAAMPQDNKDRIWERRDMMRRLCSDFGAATDPARRAVLLDPSLGLPPEDAAFLSGQLREQDMAALRQDDREAVVEILAGPDSGEAGVPITDFFSGWAESDPIRAAQGLERLPEEKKTPAIYSEFAAKWARGNVGMASQWVKDLPEGETKQGAVRGLVAGLREDYPVEAAIWAGTLTDSQAKLSELQRLLTGTSGPAAEGLKTAVNGLSLTPEEKSLLKLPAAP